MSIFWNGFRVVESVHAVEHRKRYLVERLPIRKRRRGYRVVCEHYTVPVAFVTAGAMFVHPSAMAALKQALKP